MVHIGVSSSNLYAKFAGTMMLSLFENHNTPPTSSITVHILHDSTLTQDNRDKFIYLAGQYGQRVELYNVEELCADKIAEIKRLIPGINNTRFTIATIYRLLAPYVLPMEIEKVIYFDADIVINLDINELWLTELNDNSLAAVPEAKMSYLDHPINAKKKFLIVKGFVDYDDYFCAGVILMNLKILRNEKENVRRGIDFLNAHPEMDCWDQDVLNCFYSKSCLKLSEKFDVMVGHERRVSDNQPQIHRAIYHYGDSLHGAGYGLDMRDPFNRLWLKYFVKTPWFDEETIGRLYSGVQQLNVNLKNFAVQVSALMSGKTRGFFAAPNDVEALKKLFAIRTDEQIITADNPDSLNKLLDAMKRARGRKVFFIMLPNFPFQMLIQAGFASGKDFLNGLEFLSEAQGVPMNSYPLIQAM